jgi:hypothetical protein
VIPRGLGMEIVNKPGLRLVCTHVVDATSPRRTETWECLLGSTWQTCSHWSSVDAIWEGSYIKEGGR